MARARFLLLVQSLTSFDTANALGLSIAPVSASVTAPRTVAPLRVESRRKRPAVFGVSARRWSMRGGREVTEPCRDLIATPEAFAVMPGRQHVVRIGIEPDFYPHERAFQIVLRELSDGSPSAHGEIALPTFIAPVEARAKLMLAAVRQNGGMALHVRNVGCAHARINRIEALDVGAVKAPHYVLAGAHADIPLPSRAQWVRVVSSAYNTPARERMIYVG